MELSWFKIKVIYPVTSKPINTESEEESDEDEVLKRIRFKQAEVTDEYETGMAFFNLSSDPIMHLVPGCFIPKERKRYYTMIVFESGNSITAEGKPEDIYKEIEDYFKIITKK